MRLFPFLSCKVAEMTIKSSNLPESYIKRSMEQVYWRTPKAPMYRQVEVKRKDFKFDMNRPWTLEFRNLNAPGKRHHRIVVEPIREWSFFKGDRVELLTGRDKGKQGLVNYIVQERNWVTVEGLNCEYKYIGRRRDFPGMMIKDEQPLLVTSQVALLDPTDDKPTQVEWRYTEEGQRVRVSKRTGRLIPIPKLAEETVDYKTRSTYHEQPKDTVTDEVTKVTYAPALRTFEMDLMEKLNIKEDRVPAPTYWYYVDP